jgi:hypothetical protein
MDAIKPVFRDLGSVNFLKRCVHGETQKPNESLNSIIWTRIPKTIFVRLDTRLGYMMQYRVLMMV